MWKLWAVCWWVYLEWQKQSWWFCKSCTNACLSWSQDHKASMGMPGIVNGSLWPVVMEIKSQDYCCSSGMRCIVKGILMQSLMNIATQADCVPDVLGKSVTASLNALFATFFLKHAVLQIHQYIFPIILYPTCCYEDRSQLIPKTVVFTQSVQFWL